MLTNLSGIASNARERAERISSRLEEAARASFRSPLTRSASAASSAVPSFSTPTRGPGVPSASEGSFSGEFLSEQLAASRLSGGVAGNDLCVFVMSPDFAQGFCLGAVSGGVKFCTQGVGTCSVQIHRSKKVSVSNGHLYIAAGRNSAYTQHHADAAHLQQVQLNNVLRERRSLQDWVQLLHGLNLAKQEASFARPTLSAITPSKKRKECEDNDVAMSSSPTPSLAGTASDESDGLVIIASASSEDDTNEVKVEIMSSQWELVIGSLNRLTTAFKRFKTEVIGDFDALEDRVTGVDARIGQPVQGSSFEDCVTAWDGLVNVQGILEERVDNVAEDVALKIADEGARVKGCLRVVDGHLEEIATVIKILNDEQAVLGAHVQLNASPISEAAFRDLQTDVRSLKTAAYHSAGGGIAGDYSSTKADAEIAALKIQMNILASRIPMDATMSLGGNVFKSKGDVQLFVEKKMTTNLFHLCHDPITLLESLTGVHVEKKEVLSEMYQAGRVGMNDAEARHCASFRLILPTVFGYVKEGGAPGRHNLPAVKSFKDWNPRDGTSGVKNYIASGLDDLKLQVRAEIEESFPPDEMEAKSLARDMHDASQTFLAELIAFSGDFFDELMHSSDTSEEEGWELLSALFKRIFEEFRRVRASAANASREKNQVSKCASYLWASIQAHRVVKEMLDARFRNHVSIAPVIILHVFKTRVTKVAHSAAIKRLEGRIAALEKQDKKEVKK